MQDFTAVPKNTDLFGLETYNQELAQYLKNEFANRIIPLFIKRK